MTQIKLSDITYHECPGNFLRELLRVVEPQCQTDFIVTGKAENNSTNRSTTLIFWAHLRCQQRLRDANRTRLGSITEVPPGVSDFELRISVPVSLHLKLKQFKAAGFSAQVRR